MYIYYVFGHVSALLTNILSIVWMCQFKMSFVSWVAVGGYDTKIWVGVWATMCLPLKLVNIRAVERLIF